MFYLSRAERWALYALLVLLISGAGVLAYAQGRNAARARGPLLVPVSQAAAVQTGQRREEAQPLPDSPPAETESDAESEARTSQPRVLSLNKATAEELDSLPGIGPVYAASIVAYREKKWREKGCGFENTDELLNVPGIGPKRFEAIRDLVAP